MREDDGVVVDFKDHTLNIFGNSFQGTHNDKLEAAGTLTMNDARRFVMHDGPLTIFAIYEITGDTLKYSIIQVSDKRLPGDATDSVPIAGGNHKPTPDDFKTEGRKGRITYILKRMVSIW